MRIYKVSQNLVDILIEQGFADYTDKFYPSHYKRMQAEGYNPYSMKRIFAFPQHSDFLIFHYVYMILHHDGIFMHTEERSAITEEELKSLIAFYKMPVQQGKDWLEAWSNALDLHKYYRNILLLPEVFNSQLDGLIQQTYEGVRIAGE